MRGERVHNTIRLATSRDIATLQRTGTEAGEAFSDIGMREIAEDPAPKAENYMQFIRSERAWVVADEGDCAIAYVLVDVVDGCAHIEQMTVSQDHARH